MMAAAAKAPPAPTAEQLDLALRQLWRPGYPRTLDAALAHPTFGSCVKGLARNLARAAPPAARVHRLPAAPVPPTPTAPLARNKRAPALDRKRAAANDRDDD